jgi:hypothetical protein
LIVSSDTNNEHIVVAASTGGYVLLRVAGLSKRPFCHVNALTPDIGAALSIRR